MHVARGRADGECCSRGALGPKGQAAKEALTLAPLGAEGALPRRDLREGSIGAIVRISQVSGAPWPGWWVPGARG